MFHNTLQYSAQSTMFVRLWHDSPQ